MFFLFALLMMAIGIQEAVTDRTCSMSFDEERSKMSFEMDYIGQRGRQGRPGKHGVMGPVGPKGNRGQIGPGGKIGPKGSKGTRGEKGEKGSLSEDVKAGFRLELARMEERIKKLENGWVKFGSHWFWFSNYAMNYETARVLCISKGGRLASKGLRNSSERRSIVGSVTTYQSRYWIGLDDRSREGTFVWSDGVRSVHSNTEWARNEPNNDKNQDCATLQHDRQGIDDTSCSLNYRAICEFD